MPVDNFSHFITQPINPCVVSLFLLAVFVAAGVRDWLNR